jgi:hypothetical protein|tara:strand:+ start:53988 stop:54095 length:108 start_codon:yes stop_codon:yes gene_type:complete
MFAGCFLRVANKEFLFSVVFVFLFVLAIRNHFKLK